MLSEEDLRSNTPPGGFGISKLVRSRSSILRRGQPAFLFTDQHQLQHPSFSCLHTSLTSLTTPPPTTQLSPNSFSRLQIFSLSGGVVLSWRVHPWPGCRTLAGTVAGRQGVTVRSRAGHRGRRAGTRLARVSACHGSRGHSRDTGQGTVGEPLAAARAAAATVEAAPASPAGDPAAPALLDITLAAGQCH